MAGITMQRQSPAMVARVERAHQLRTIVAAYCPEGVVPGPLARLCDNSQALHVRPERLKRDLESLAGDLRERDPMNIAHFIARGGFRSEERADEAILRALSGLPNSEALQRCRAAYLEDPGSLLPICDAIEELEAPGDIRTFFESVRVYTRDAIVRDWANWEDTAAVCAVSARRVTLDAAARYCTADRISYCLGKTSSSKAHLYWRHALSAEAAFVRSLVATMNEFLDGPSPLLRR